MRWRRPKLISPPDQQTPHQLRNMRKTAIAEGRYLVLRAKAMSDAGEGGVIRLEDHTYILEESLVLGDGMHLLGEGAVLDCNLLTGETPAIRINGEDCAISDLMVEMAPVGVSVPMKPWTGENP